MIAGHFAFVAAVRARDKSAPLWALMVATQWLDVVFVLAQPPRPCSAPA